MIDCDSGGEMVDAEVTQYVAITRRAYRDQINDVGCIFDHAGSNPARCPGLPGP